MGIQGLFGVLKSIQKPCKLEAFRGQTLGVDAYGWLHRGAVACAIELATDKPTRKHIDFAMHRVRMLMHFGIKPYVVFDGDRLPSKKHTEEARATRRRASKTRGLELLKQGKETIAYQELQKCVDITPAMARQFIEDLKKLQIPYLVAPYEADSQLAYLERHGIIDGILSEDSDLLVFGAKILLTKLDQYGGCVMIRRADFPCCREMDLATITDADLRCMAILSGCDYLEGLPRMGLRTAHKVVRKHRQIDRVLRAIQLVNKIRVPPDYSNHFEQASLTFEYQLVFCPNKQEVVHLTHPLDTTHAKKLRALDYLGTFGDNSIARGVADGTLNPMTKAPIELASEHVHGRYKTTRVMVASHNLGKENKPIDAFFKPKRTPLAELDPNTFASSPTQQRALRHGQNRPGWHSEMASQRETNTDNIGASISLQPPPATVPRCVKRPRLCIDQPEEATAQRSPLKTSKYFELPMADRLGAKTNGKRSRSSAPASIHVWSDEPIPNPASTITGIHDKASRPGRKMDVLAGTASEPSQREEIIYQPVNASEIAEERHTSFEQKAELSRCLAENRSKCHYPLPISADQHMIRPWEVVHQDLRSQRFWNTGLHSQDCTDSNDTQRSSALQTSTGCDTLDTLTTNTSQITSRGTEDLMVAESDVSSAVGSEDVEAAGSEAIVADSPVRDKKSLFGNAWEGLDLGRFAFSEQRRTTA